MTVHSWKYVTQDVRLWRDTEVTVDGCWTRKVNTAQGYSKLNWDGREQLAHRVTYTLAYGSIREGLVLDHLCRNRACIRPDHLEAVTDRTNILRGVSQGARSVATNRCARGHEFTPENTRMRGEYRVCRTCHRDRATTYRNRQAS